ncbi:hypothetical protein ACS8E9_02265 [Pseudomonas neustonica]|uniref:DUF2232 domain-containing protein n=2 Tax=Pseudomonas TaxID=286 RepID=A0ABX9XMK0_9PSED|nr:hypothetical protein EF099_02135 [Pseudomonas sp. SSM44]ROZ88226.1 hypothetical protein EF096_00565 [Pseudomonas neustonica]|tara:strand:+ start:1349 stop:2248 length:900 start_codon:yes stop_codon:yes gene_type:complete
MQGLAEYIMRGRRQATLVVGLSVAIPLLFWFGAVVLALVILRRGLSEGAPVVIWGGLPALAWAMLGDPTPLLLVLGTALLASLLRERNDWSLVVLAAAPLGLIYALILLAMLHEPMVVLANELQGMMPKVLGELGKDLSEADMARLQSLMLPILAGLTGAVHALLTLASLILARAWQARLFNPGGFREEFHQLRLKPWMAVSLLLLVFVAPQFGDMAVVAPVSTVPLLLAGLALIHGIVGIKQLSLAWLIAMYVALLFASQAAVPLIMLLAFIDSLFDFRSRLKPENGLGGDDESNGQG